MRAGRVDWLDPDWLEEAHAWIRAHTPGSVSGPIEQPHVYPWSTVLRVPMEEGNLWFKANSEVGRFEAGLVAELAEAAPDVIVELVAVDVARGWMLMRDAGTRLRELVGTIEQVKHWQEILPRYAELQLALAPRADRFRAIGVPDERLEGLAGRYERLLDDVGTLLVGQPDGVTTEELARLHAAVPEVASMSSELASIGMPETIQHDDFNDGQIFVRDGRYRFLDWGDSCVSHPFHTLVVTFRALASQQELAPGAPELLRLRDVYLEPFADFASLAELRDAFGIAYRTGTIGRALAWARFFSASPDERDDTVAYGLKMFLANGPIGAWAP